MASNKSNKMKNMSQKGQATGCDFITLDARIQTELEGSLSSTKAIELLSVSQWIIYGDKIQRKQWLLLLNCLLIFSTTLPLSCPIPHYLATKSSCSKHNHACMPRCALTKHWLNSTRSPRAFMGRRQMRTGKVKTPKIRLTSMWQFFIQQMQKHYGILLYGGIIG